MSKLDNIQDLWDTDSTHGKILDVLGGLYGLCHVALYIGVIVLCIQECAA